MKSLAPNTMIQNRYLIVHLIGKGGMGEVYLAVDQRLGSAIALKRTFFADDEMLGNAFEREARTLARLRHPVLPKVSDHFAENGEQYLVMEHIAGEDLSKRLEALQKPFPLSWVLFWADQLLDALSYLHSHEPPIIHRDIKPQNLKLTDENHIVLLDFGLSKNSTGQTITSSSGSTGSVVGYTPHYAPMEQIRGTGTSARSDLYSLSATLYQLMTNVVPADALSRADALLNAMADPIRPMNEVNPEISPEVSAVILKGMEVSQEKRWPNARDMQRALRKAYSSMQEAMSANTVAFNANTDLGVARTGSLGNPAPPAEPLDQVPVSNEGPTRISHVSQAASHGSISQGDSGIRQADVKTEVYSGDSSPFAGAVSAQQTDQGTPAFDAKSTPGAAEQNSYSPDATVPNVSYGAPELMASGAAAASTPEFFTAPNIETEAPQEAAENNYDSQSRRQSAAAASVSAGAGVLPVKKKSSSKTFLLLGTLAGIFVIGLIALAGGWFVYQNYYAGAAAEPSPSPYPSPQFSPSPAPTMEAIVESNTADNSNSDSSVNTNSTAIVEPTPEARAEPAQVPTTPRSTPPPVTARATPARPAATPVARSTPRPRSGSNRTDIIQ